MLSSTEICATSARGAALQWPSTDHDMYPSLRGKRPEYQQEHADGRSCAAAAAAVAKRHATLYKHSATP